VPLRPTAALRAAPLRAARQPCRPAAALPPPCLLRTRADCRLLPRAARRPYLSVHAPEWDRYGNFGPPPGSGVVLGATNPVLARSPPAWQSLLVLAEEQRAPPSGLAGSAAATLRDSLAALSPALGAAEGAHGERVASWTTQAPTRRPSPPDPGTHTPPLTARPRHPHAAPGASRHLLPLALLAEGGDGRTEGAGGATALEAGCRGLAGPMRLLFGDYAIAIWRLCLGSFTY
jgi:hypothetical protein